MLWTTIKNFFHFGRAPPPRPVLLEPLQIIPEEDSSSSSTSSPPGSAFYTPPLTPTPTTTTSRSLIAGLTDWIWPSNSQQRQLPRLVDYDNTPAPSSSSSSLSSLATDSPSSFPTSSPLPMLLKQTAPPPPALVVLPPRGPNNFVLTYEKNRNGKFLITAYDDDDKFGRIFLLACTADGFVDLLEALVDNADSDCVTKIPPPGTRVVARLGRDGDERDNSPILQQLGGIHNKAWRGIINTDFVYRPNYITKALVTFTDLGITEEVHISDIFLPSKEVSCIPFDQFGSWVQLDNVNINNTNRRFYRSQYRSLFAEPLIFNNVHVKKAYTNAKGEVQAIVELIGDGPNISSVLEKLQHWDYEQAIKHCSTKTPVALMEEMYGYGLDSRIKFDNISQPRVLSLDVKYNGMITVVFGEVDGLFLFEVSGGGDIEDDKRIWIHHLNNYYALTHQKDGKSPSSSYWYPQIDDVFLLRTEVEEGVGWSKKKSVIWRRVVRKSMQELWDVDDTEFVAELHKLPPNTEMIPAPKELLDLPNGAVRILLPDYKISSKMTGEERFFDMPITVKIKSYNEEHLAHVVEADDNFINTAWRHGWLVRPEGFPKNILDSSDEFDDYEEIEFDYDY